MNLDLASIPLTLTDTDNAYAFNLTLLTNYKKMRNGLDYEYHSDDEIVNKDNNYSKWLYLQALNCLAKIYLEQSDDDTIIDINMSEPFFKALLSIVNNVDNDNFNVTASFDDSKIEILLPYLCAYMGYKYQKLDEERIKILIDKIVTKLNKNTYQIFEKIPKPMIKEYNSYQLKSSIPFIEFEYNVIGIEFLDEKKKIGSLTNIYILEKDNYNVYKNVFIKLDPKYILDVKSKSGRLYRQGVAKILLDKERTNRIITKRSGYFGIIQLDLENKKINKLVEADTLYESDMLMDINKYKNINNIDSYIE